MSGDPSKKCYVDRKSPAGMSSNKKKYNKWYRENVLKSANEIKRLRREVRALTR